MNEIPKIGETFDGKYEIEEILGKSSSGTVFKALQLDCRRTVALKILHLEIPETNVGEIGSDQDSREALGELVEEYRKRFLREAKALSKLSQVNIVTVYHLGVSSSNMPYLAMELVQGQSIRALIDASGRLPVLQALKIVRDVALAMSYVHQHDMIHRDLKPENILIEQRPEPDTVKLIDFGLVRPANQQEQKLTRTGQIMGTAKHMSPEQCMGETVDFRTDIYSLSSCFYEMIVGKAPFEADTVVGLMYKHLNEAVPKIESSTVDFFHSQLNNIISKGMSKDPKQRFGSMAEMANQLDNTLRLLDARGSPQADKRPLVFSAGLIFLCATLLCSLFFLWNMKQQHSAQIKGLSPLVLRKKSKNNYERDYERYRRLLARVERDKGPYHPDLMPILDNLAALLEQEKKYAEAEQLLKRLIAIEEKAFGPDKPVVRQSIQTLAECYEKQGKDAEAEALFQRSLAIKEKTNDPDLAMSITSLGSFYEAQGKHLEAEAQFKRSLAIREATLQANDPAIAESLRDLALCYLRQSKIDKITKAEPLLRRALAIREKSLPANDPAIAECLSDLASSCQRCAEMYDSTGNFREALTYRERSVAIYERVKGPESFEVLMGFIACSTLYARLGDFTQAYTPLKRAVANAAKGSGANSSGIDFELNTYKKIPLKAKLPEDVACYMRRQVACFQQLLAIEEGRKAPCDRLILELYRHQAGVNIALGNLDHAEQICQEQFRKLENEPQLDKWEYEVMLSTYKDALQASGRLDEAEAVQRRMESLKANRPE